MEGRKSTLIASKQMCLPCLSIMLYLYLTGVDIISKSVIWAYRLCWKFEGELYFYWPSDDANWSKKLLNIPLRDPKLPVLGPTGLTFTGHFIWQSRLIFPGRREVTHFIDLSFLFRMQECKRLAATLDSLWQAPRNTSFLNVVLWPQDWGTIPLFTESLLGLSSIIYCASRHFEY